jgi:hypothetical protein
MPLAIALNTLPLLDQWERELRGLVPPSDPSWRPEGPGRTPIDAAPLIAYLREHAVSGEPLTYNVLHRENHGGRLYPFYVAGYEGPLTISKNKYNEAGRRGPRLLLAAIRRDVRALLEAPTGWSLLELDYRACHAAIALALSGDEQLAADLERDIHQATGDRFVSDVDDPAKRRDIGKFLNNAMLFGISAQGLRQHALLLLGRLPRDGTGQGVLNAWWARYPRLAAFRDEVETLVRDAQLLRCALEIVAPSGSVSRFSAGEVAGVVGRGRQAPGRDGAWRTVFSAAFRAVEGDLMDLVFRHFAASRVGGRLALPIYDGALVAAPRDLVEGVQQALLAAAKKAVEELGVPQLEAVVKRR